MNIEGPQCHSVMYAITELLPNSKKKCAVQIGAENFNRTIETLIFLSRHLTAF